MVWWVSESGEREEISRMVRLGEESGVGVGFGSHQ